jgi:hypothetical protein
MFNEDSLHEKMENFNDSQGLGGYLDCSNIVTIDDLVDAILSED